MMNEVFKFMLNFPNSYINRFGELILSTKGNVFVRITGAETWSDIVCKVLEYCSRSIAKGEPYANKKGNLEWRNDLRKSLNSALRKAFTEEDMRLIYDKLGNGINHELAKKFVESNFDLTILQEDKT